MMLSIVDAEMVANQHMQTRLKRVKHHRWCMHASAQLLALSLAELLLLQYPVSVSERVVQRFCPRSLSGNQQAVWAVCAPLLLCMLRVLISSCPGKHGNSCFLT
jgi:hypothetical protein